MTDELTFKQESSSSLRAIIGVLLFCFCLAMAAVIVLAVVFANEKKTKDEGTDMVTVAPEMPSEPDPCAGNTIDVAVVGAGVSGVYSAYKLSQNYDWNIHIYEANDRVGGRTFSVEMPGLSDFRADIGAMRFKKKSHTRLLELAEGLGLTVQPFNTPNETNTLYYMRGKLFGKAEMATGNVPYDMTDEERAFTSDVSALHAYWNNMIIANGSKHEDPWERVCTDGKKAYEKGNFNAFLEVGSLGAIEYFTDISGFPGETYNSLNYAEWSDTDYTPPSQNATPDQRYTFKEGFQELSLRMMETIRQSTRNQLFKNHELVSVTHNGTMGHLSFMDKANYKTVEVCAKDVVLGLPAEALKRIDFMDRDIAKVLDELLPSVKQGPATKTFLVYDNPWWRTIGKGPIFESLKAEGTDVKFILTDLPAGMILEIGVDSETGKAMLLIYSDWWKNVHFWAPYMINGERHNSQLESEFMASEKLIRQINLQLAEVFNISINDVPMPDSSVSHAWYKAPYWTAWHDKTAGYHFPTVIEKMLKPVDTKGVYIVGEAFSNNQVWVEGALETSQNMLSRYFNIAF